VDRNLIVNADDLGWTAGVNRGIAEAHRNGIVTSASLLANGRAFEEAVEFARATRDLGVGVHLNLSDGPPVAPREAVPSLLNASGAFEGGPDGLLFHHQPVFPRIIHRAAAPQKPSPNASESRFNNPVIANRCQT